MFQASKGTFAAPVAVLVPPFMHDLAHLLTVVLQLFLKHVLGPTHPTRSRLAYHLKAISDLKVVGAFNVTAKRLRDLIFLYVILTQLLPNSIICMLQNRVNTVCLHCVRVYASLLKHENAFIDEKFVKYLQLPRLCVFVSQVWIHLQIITFQKYV